MSLSGFTSECRGVDSAPVRSARTAGSAAGKLPGKRFMNTPRCMVCQSEDTASYWDRVWHAADSRVYVCGHCHLLFLWPRMTMDEQRSHYENYGAHLVSRGVVASTETADEGFRRCEERQQYRFERLLPHFSNRGTFLEIGGGYGNFMGQLIDKGVVEDAVFVESSAERLAFVQERFGITGCSRLDQVNGRRFDVILMFHVLEHIDRPVEFIDQCKRLLNDGGRMVIEVPSSDDPLLTIYDCSAYKDFYFQPMHPAVYSRNALSYLMTRCGLTPHDWMYVQRYGLANHLQWLSAGIPGGAPEMERFIGRDVDAQYVHRLCRQQKTDTIIGIFHNGANPAPSAMEV